MKRVIPGYQPLVTSEGHHVFLFPANYERCNFARLLDESRQPGNNGSVTWKSHSKSKEGDVVYFYYNHLPSDNGNTQKRILMRGIVTESEHLVPRDLVENCDSKELVKGIRIGHLQPVCLKEETKFSSEVVETKYHQTFVIKNRQLNEDSRELFEELEKEVSRGKKYSFEDMIDYFQTPCFFERMLHPKNASLTFMRRNNGLLYYERHHVIPQNTKCKNRNAEFGFLVDDENNKVNLCPYCHARIHNGTREDVAKMVELLYEAKKGFFAERNLAELVGEDPLNWLKSVYHAM